jgi:transposase-like protein
MDEREMNCVYCESERIVKNGKEQAVGKSIQVYRCKDCGRRFNERSGTPMARLRADPIALRSPQRALHQARSQSCLGLG